MQSKKVSVIVPIYNVEKYIGKCVDSIRNQDYPNIEIILVDDGSPDKSPQIIDEMASNDERIKVIHEKNGGVSSARNRGIAAATGEYIMFVDGDDWVDDDYVSYFVDLIEKHGCDIGMDKNNYMVEKTMSADKSYRVSAEKAIEWIYLGTLFVAVWNKIYKTSLLRESGVLFNEEIWYGEGMLFNIECLQCVEEVAIGEKAVYHQTYNPDSAMRSFNLESNFCGIRSMELQKDVWKKKSRAIKRAWTYHRYCFNRTIIGGLVDSEIVDENREVYDECVRNLRKGILIPLSVERNPRKIMGWLMYFANPMLMANRGKRKKKQTLDIIRGGAKTVKFDTVRVAVCNPC